MKIFTSPTPSDVGPYPSDEYQRALMEWIIERVWAWKDGYYNKNGSQVDDATYDLWWNNLLSLEKNYPHLVVEGTPTGAVGAPLERSTDVG